MKLRTLDDELTMQGDLMQEYRKEMTVLTQQYGIPYFEDGESYVGATNEALYHAGLERMNTLNAERFLPQAQLETLKNANEENLVMTAIAIEIPRKPGRGKLREVLGSRRRGFEVSSLLAGGLALADGDPTVVARKIRAARAAQDVKMALVSLKGLLEAKLQILDRQIEKCGEAAEKAQTHRVDVSLKQYNYNHARRNYERARDFYEQLKERQQEARVALKMPKTPLTIHQKPE